MGQLIILLVIVLIIIYAFKKFSKSSKDLQRIKNVNGTIKLKNKQNIYLVLTIIFMVIGAIVFKLAYDSKLNLIKDSVRDYYHNKVQGRDVNGNYNNGWTWRTWSKKDDLMVEEEINKAISDGHVDGVPASYIIGSAIGSFITAIPFLILFLIELDRKKNGASREIQKLHDKISNDIQFGEEFKKRYGNLLELYEQRLVTFNEFSNKSNALRDEYENKIHSLKIEKNINDKLEVLNGAYKNGILTEEEYNLKVEELKLSNKML